MIHSRPATVLAPALAAAALAVMPQPAGAGVAFRAYGIDGVSFDVGVPPRSTSTLRVPYTAGLPLWPDLDLRLRFVLGTRLTTGAAGTLPRERKVVAPQPAIAGRVAVHLTLQTAPASGLTSFAGRPPIARGKAVAITGHANPPIPGQRVELRYARVSKGSKVLERGRAARPRVDARGTFRARWTPPRPGDYELWARFVSRRPGLVSDDMCPRLLRVKRG